MKRLLLAVALACVGMVWLLKSDAGAVDLHVGTGRALLAGNKAAPSWFTPNSSVDCQFGTGCAVAGAGLVSYGSLFALSRNSAETCRWIDGHITYVSANQPCVTDLGYGSTWKGGTNIALQSNFQSGWSTNNTTLTPANAVSPDLTMNAATITEAATTSSHSVSQASISVTSGQIYTISAFIGLGTRGVAQLLASSSAFSGNGAVNVNLATCALHNVGTVVATGADIYSDSAGNVYCRVWVALTATANNSNAGPGIALANSINAARNVSYLGTGLTINAFCFQFENTTTAKPYPSPCIPTTNATATLAPDVVTIAGQLATDLAGATGTIVSNTDLAQPATAATLIDANGTTLLGKTAGDLGTTSVGATLNSSNSGVWNGADDLGLSWDGTGGILNLEGTTVTDATARTPSGPFYLGSTSGSSNFCDCQITRITAYATKQAVPQFVVSQPFRSFANLTKSPSNPIIPYNVASWNTTGADAPYIRPTQKVGGTYYSVTQGDTGASTWLNFNSYSSTDGVAWTPCASNPVMTATTSQWDDHFIAHPAIVKSLFSATWLMFYTARGSGGGAFGLATSPDISQCPSVWTKNANNPLPTPGAGQAQIPTVITMRNAYYLYVATLSASPADLKIYILTSPNGIAWRYAGVALYTQPTDWDNQVMLQEDPFVVINPQGYCEMTYTADFGAGVPPFTNQAIGYQVSPDCIHWKKYQNLILEGTGNVSDFDDLYPGDSVLFFNPNGSVQLYYAGVNSAVVPQGGVLTVNYLLNRDLDPCANDNTPLGLNKTA